jgi:hypothetical protein
MCAGNATAKLEGVTGKLSGLYSDLESEKQVGSMTFVRGT